MASTLTPVPRQHRAARSVMRASDAQAGRQRGNPDRRTAQCQSLSREAAGRVGPPKLPSATARPSRFEGFAVKLGSDLVRSGAMAVAALAVIIAPRTAFADNAPKRGGTLTYMIP